jgi:hypothetical protein
MNKALNPRLFSFSQTMRRGIRFTPHLLACGAQLPNKLLITNMFKVTHK